MEDKKTFMNLMTDFAFKYLFGSKKRKKLLIRFLNIILEDEKIRVEDVTYLDKEVLPEDANGKRIVYDIYCTTPDEKEHIILEMQQLYHDLFENRAIYYWSKSCSMQGKKGWNYDLKPIYSIFLVDFHFPHMTRSGIHDVKLMDIHSHEIYSDVLNMKFIHLNEAKKKWGDCKTEYDKILFLIKNMHTMDKKSEAYRSGEFGDIFKESEICSMAAEDIVAYGESYQKYVDTLAAVDYAARDSYSKGIERGIEQGIERGIEQGIERGIERERRDSIIRMSSVGMDIQQIAYIYGLPIDEVRRILSTR